MGVGSLACCVGRAGPGGVSSDRDETQNHTGRRDIR